MKNFKNIILLTAFIICGIICFSCQLKASAAAAENENFAKLNTDLQLLIDDNKNGVPGVGAAVIKDDRLVYEKTLGSRYIDNENPQNNLPLTRDTKLRIASLSKVFVAAACMQLAEQGKIDLDADISRYLGFTLRNPNYPDTPITSKMLLSHTSSLRDGEVYTIPSKYSLQELFRPDGMFYEGGAHYAPYGEAPGEFFCYTNLNYGILGTIIEKVTQTRFDKYMKQAIFDPMEIDASFNITDFNEAALSDFGLIYQKQEYGVWNTDGPWIPQVDDYFTLKIYGNNLYNIYNYDEYITGTNATIFFPHGGLRISLAGLENWMQMLIDNGKYKGKRILTEKSIDEMFKPYWTLNEAKTNGDTYGGLMNCFGLGIQNVKNIDKDRFLPDRDIEMSGHFAEAYGLLAGMFIDREHKNGFIYIMNGIPGPESANAGAYSGMYLWEEKVCSAILNNAFPEL